MTKETNNSTLPNYVITGADEGIQMNEGIRLGFLGAGLDLPGFEQAVSILQETFKDELNGREIAVVSSQEDDWQDEALKARNVAVVREKFEAWAKPLGLAYAGHLDFGDPRELEMDLKGHLVRPPKIHVADSIRLTCGGGEQVFNLRNYVLSADWLYKADLKSAAELFKTQIEYLRTMAKRELQIVYEVDGTLDPKIAAINREFAEKIVAQI